LKIRPKILSIVPKTGILCIIPPKIDLIIEKIIIKIRNKMKKDIISPITIDKRYKYESYTVERF
jgi:hypothetical protein